MRIYDDEQFQAYLKRFQPLAPDPLPATARARRTHPFLGLAAAAALIARVTSTEPRTTAFVILNFLSDMQFRRRPIARRRCPVLANVGSVVCKFLARCPAFGV